MEHRNRADILTDAQLALLSATERYCEDDDQRPTSEMLRVMRDKWHEDIIAALNAVPNMEGGLRQFLGNFARNLFIREMCDVLRESGEITD